DDWIRRKLPLRRYPDSLEERAHPRIVRPELRHQLLGRARHGLRAAGCAAVLDVRQRHDFHDVAVEPPDQRIGRLEDYDLDTIGFIMAPAKTPARRGSARPG